MSGYLVCAAVLMVGGLGPALLISARGGPIDRLVGLELVSSIAVVLMLLIAQIADQSYFLAAPLVLAPLSFAGTLVYTRLLGSRDDAS